MSEEHEPAYSGAAAQANFERTGKYFPDARPLKSFLVDKFNRQHTYLRISITEKCNLRCVYCMPEEGVELSPTSKLLTSDEIVEIARLFVSQGVTKIRLTGGEPTVRKDIIDLVRRLGELRPLGLREIAMTSNGIALGRKLEQLKAHGLTHLNLSLDTLDPHTFEIMTRRRGLEAVLRTVDRALELGYDPVKINTVVMRSINLREVNDFIELTRTRPVQLRFIEYMPFDGNRWDLKKMVPYRELLDVIRAKHPGLYKVQDADNDTAKAWRVPGYAGQVAFITSMSDHFCGTCNRLRITSDGALKVCLFGNNEVSLRDLLRDESVTEPQLVDIIKQAVGRKKAKHAGIGQLEHLKNRPMILIGG